MAVRTSWKGTISFGLVTMPCGITPVVSEEKTAFKTFSPAGNPMGRLEVDKVTQLEVPRSEQLRGVVVGDKIVTVTDEELNALAPEASKNIEITQFVNAAEITSYAYRLHQYIVPQPGGDRAYAILVAALAKTRKVGIGTLVQRGRRHVVAVQERDGVLTLAFLHYASDLRSAPTISVDAEPRMVKMATELIETMTEPFDYASFQDDQERAVAELIESKAAGTPAKAVPAAAHRPAVDDLMAALEASIKATKPVPTSAKPKRGRKSVAA